MAKTRAPAHLQPATRKWFSSVVDDYDMDQHHVRLLALAGEAWDRGQQAREAIERDGITVATADGGIKAHPAVAIERDCRIAFARLIRELALDTDAAPEAPRMARTRDYGSRR